MAKVEVYNRPLADYNVPVNELLEYVNHYALLICVALV
jgi:hypothetical protein